MALKTPKPEAAKPVKAQKTTTGRTGAAWIAESSKPIDAAKWKARKASLVPAGEAVHPKPKNGARPAARAEISSQPTTAGLWKADRDARPKPAAGAPAKRAAASPKKKAGR